MHFLLLFKVSMKFNKEEVFPGTTVKLSLKASPGSVFAISAVDKSVHFLGNANDISRGQVRHSLGSLTNDAKWHFLYQGRAFICFIHCIYAIVQNVLYQLNFFLLHSRIY